MKLTYRLLWFDNEPSMVQKSERRLARMMRDKGFDLKVDPRDDISPEAIEKLRTDLEQYNPYDLIVFDHDLGTRKGTDIAQKLRGAIFTDMVYYSAAPLDVLRKAIYDAAVDGIFLINKLSCVDDLMRILEDHIKKNCDLNSMRGIVLDALSEMEVKLRKYLTDKLRVDPALCQDRLASFKDRLDGRSKQLAKKAIKMTEALMLASLADPLKSDFNTIRQMLSACEEDWESLKDKQALHRLQNLRNVFAHESYKWDRQNNCVTVCVDGEERSYRNSDFETIRKDLLTMFEEVNTRCKGDKREGVDE